MNRILVADYKEEEIVEALKSIGPTKASRPDDFPAIFFQKFWFIVGKEICEFCLEVLNKGMSLQPLNHMNLVLIPKSAHPNSPINFKPICLCSMFYKII